MSSPLPSSLPPTQLAQLQGNCFSLKLSQLPICCLLAASIMSVILCTGESFPQRAHAEAACFQSRPLHPHKSPPPPHDIIHSCACLCCTMSEGSASSDKADEELPLLCTAGYDHTIRYVFGTCFLESSPLPPSPPRPPPSSSTHHPRSFSTANISNAYLPAASGRHYQESALELSSTPNPKSIVSASPPTRDSSPRPVTTMSSSTTSSQPTQTPSSPSRATQAM